MTAARFLLCVTPLLLGWRAARGDVLPENAALLAFKREQVALAQGVARNYGPMELPELQAWIRGAQKRAGQIESATGDAATASLTLPSAPFILQERAYFAADGGAQPFWVALPRDYSPNKKWPLAVFLHGYSTSISKLSPWILDADTLEAATKRGLIVAMPYGRRNSDFVQWGEDDALAVKRECTRTYALDANRVYLTGTSMGGYGAYAVGLHTPHEWAAVAPISGRTDFDLWFKMKRANLPAWKRLPFDADDPRTLIENGRATPFFIQHGALDQTVPVEHSRLFAADAARLRLPVEFVETPDAGHESAFQFPALGRAFEWLSRQAPHQTPRQLTLVTGDLREARNDWAQIEAFSDYSQTARLDARIEGGAVKVTTRNVARFSLDLKEFALGTVALEVDGAKVGDLDAGLPIAWNAPNAKVGKSPLCCGPFKSLLRGAFTLVYGNEHDRRDALRFAREWNDDSDGAAPIKAATDVTDADKRDRNLILFGTRDTNPLLRAVAPDLPVELTTTGYRVGDRLSDGKNVGLRMVWRSPWAPARLLGVCSGAWWGATLPVNHKWDLLPDYLLYAGDAHNLDGTDTAVVGGNFDGDWKLP